MEQEIWKDIKGCEGMYQISNTGKIKSIARKVMRSTGKFLPIKERVLKNMLSTTGYHYVHVRGKELGTKMSLHIHRIVAIHFIENPNNYGIVNHINGIKTDNRIENLEWCTKSHDVLHSYRVLGRKNKMPAGKDNYKSIPVFKYTLSGKLMEAYVSITDCCKQNGISRFGFDYFMKKGNLNKGLKGFLYTHSKI